MLYYTQYEIVNKIVGIGQYPNEIYLQIQWLGLPDAIDLTWVSLQTMCEDTPDTMVAFLQNDKLKTSIITRAKQSINLKS